MTRLLVIGALLFVAGCSGANTDPSKWRTGQVLSESIQDLSAGFGLVHREIVNPAAHWEGVGHFSFVYFHDKRLCQCGHGDFSISPSKQYAVLHDGPTGKLLLFNTLTERITEVTKEYVGSPNAFTWNEEKGAVVVTFDQGLKNGYKDAAPLSIRLQ